MDNYSNICSFKDRVALVTGAVNFDSEVRPLRPELHSSGFGPRITSCKAADIETLKTMGFKAARTHDWAHVNQAERVCDWVHMFPLQHLDAKDPKNYYFDATDHLLRRTREEAGLEVFFRLGASIEHSGDVHFNALIPEDLDKAVEVFAGTIRHYNLALLSRFQTSALDQAYFYGCMPSGLYGYCSETGEKWKLYYGLCIFGDFLKSYGMICASQSDDRTVTTLAAKGAKGKGLDGKIVLDRIDSLSACYWIQDSPRDGG